MKRKSLLIIAMMVSSLVLIATVSVQAANETITDPIGDVGSVNFETGVTDTITYHPDVTISNLDITEITYTNNAGTVTLTLQVNGVIENRGNIEDYQNPENFNLNMIGYLISLTTSEENYLVTYVNKSCQLIYQDGTILNLTASDFSVSDNTLSVTFTLNDLTETYDSLDAEVDFMKLNIPEDVDPETIGEDALEDIYVTITDVAPNRPLTIDDITTFVFDSGLVGETIQFNGSASPLAGQPPYEYNWDFGDQSTSSEDPNPTHIYTQAGEYTYNFTVTDNSGESVYVSGSIQIIKEGGGQGLSSQMVLFLAVLLVIIIVGIVVIVWIIRR
jgi:PKD repeat protein